MIHVEMMVELMAPHRESARDMELMAQAIAGFARGGLREMVGMRVVPVILRDPPLTKISSRPTCPLSHRQLSP